MPKPLCSAEAVLGSASTPGSVPSALAAEAAHRGDQKKRRPAYSVVAGYNAPRPAMQPAHCCSIESASDEVLAILDRPLRHSCPSSQGSTTVIFQVIGAEVTKDPGTHVAGLRVPTTILGQAEHASASSNLSAVGAAAEVWLCFSGPFLAHRVRHCMKGPQR